MYSPFVVHFAVKQFEPALVAGQYTKTVPTGDAPFGLDCFDLEALVFPAQGNRAFGVLEARMTFYQIFYFIIAHDWSPRFKLVGCPET